MPAKGNKRIGLPWPLICRLLCFVVTVVPLAAQVASMRSGGAQLAELVTEFLQNPLFTSELAKLSASPATASSAGSSCPACKRVR